MRINRKVGALVIAGMLMTTVTPTVTATTLVPCQDQQFTTFGVIVRVVLSYLIYGNPAHLSNVPEPDKIQGGEDEGNPSGSGYAETSVVVNQCLVSYES